MKIILKVIVVAFLSECCMCTIAGISYLDPLRQRQLSAQPMADNACNPLYWYPRNIPDSCYEKDDTKIPTDKRQIPGPIPIPIPVQHVSPPFAPYPYPQYPAYPMPMPMPMPAPPPMPMPNPPPMSFMPSPIPAIPVPLPPLPYGVPIAPTAPMVPVGGLPYPYISPPMSYPYAGQAGLVPGIPGLVTADGGINIMPFSDAYSDMLEGYKQKMIRKKMEKIIEKYDNEPWSKKYRKSHNYGRRMNYYDRRRK